MHDNSTTSFYGTGSTAPILSATPQQQQSSLERIVNTALNAALSAFVIHSQGEQQNRIYRPPTTTAGGGSGTPTNAQGQNISGWLLLGAGVAVVGALIAIFVRR